MSKKIKVKDKVKDKDGNIGIVEDDNDIHNVRVNFTNTIGWGLYCLDPNCKKYYDALEKIND